MARVVRQPLPDPPPVYDQSYLAQLADAVNRYMFQREAEAEMVAARFIMTAPVIVDPSNSPLPGSVPSTAGLPNGTLYLYKEPGGPSEGEPGYFYVSIVTENDI